MAHGQSKILSETNAHSQQTGERY